MIAHTHTNRHGQTDRQTYSHTVATGTLSSLLTNYQFCTQQHYLLFAQEQPHRQPHHDNGQSMAYHNAFVYKILYTVSLLSRGMHLLLDTYWCAFSARTQQLHNYNALLTLLIEVYAFRICTSNNALALNVYLVGDLLMMHQNAAIQWNLIHTVNISHTQIPKSRTLF